MKRTALACILAAFLGLAVLLPIGLAADLVQDISAQINQNVTILWDGVPFVATDASGYIVEPITYQNRVYVPLRSFGVKSGYAVGWDPESRTITVASPAAVEEEQTGPDEAAVEEVTVEEPPVYTADFGEPKNIILDGEITGWQFWVRNDNAYMEYHEAISLIRECTNDKVAALNYYPNSNIFNLNSKSTTLNFYMVDDYRLINISYIDRVYGHIIIDLNFETGDVNSL